jgi:hypothetical protein
MRCNPLGSGSDNRAPPASTSAAPTRCAAAPVAAGTPDHPSAEPTAASADSTGTVTVTIAAARRRHCSSYRAAYLSGAAFQCPCTRQRVRKIPSRMNASSRPHSSRRDHCDLHLHSGPIPSRPERRCRGELLGRPSISIIWNLESLNLLRSPSRAREAVEKPMLLLAELSVPTVRPPSAGGRDRARHARYVTRRKRRRSATRCTDSRISIPHS